MQTVVKYMHREGGGGEIRTPERAANSTELKPASRKTKGAWSRRSLEGLQMAQQRRRSEFRTSLERSNHRSLLHPSRLSNCCSPRSCCGSYKSRTAPNGANRPTKHHPYKVLTTDFLATPLQQRTRTSPGACSPKFSRLLLDKPDANRVGV